MKLIALTYTLLCCAITLDAQEMKRRPIVELPFAPGEAEIIDRQQRGRVEILTYQYKGKTYQEERVYAEARHVSEKGRNAMAELEKFGLTNDQSFEVVLILQRTNWKYYRHLEAKWSASSVERVRRRVATQLKSGIAHAIGSSDPAVIEQILKLKLGYEIVPMKDFVVRKNGFIDEPTP